MNSLKDYLRKYELQLDLTNVSNFFKCQICSDLLDDPLYSPCGCHFCRICITTYLEDGVKPCPSFQLNHENEQLNECGDGLIDINDDLKEDLTAKRELNRLQLKCPLTHCRDIIELKSLLNHLRLCPENRNKKCLFTNIGSNCEEVMLNNDEFVKHFTESNFNHNEAIVNNLINYQNDLSELSSNLTNITNEYQLNHNNNHLILTEIQQKQTDSIKLFEQQEATVLNAVVDFSESLKKMNERIDGMQKQLIDYQLDINKKLENQTTFILHLKSQINSVKLIQPLDGDFKWLINDVAQYKFKGEYFSNEFSLDGNNCSWKWKVSFTYAQYRYYFFKDHNLYFNLYLINPSSRSSSAGDSSAVKPAKPNIVAIIITIELLNCLTGKSVFSKSIDVEIDVNQAFLNQKYSYKIVKADISKDEKWFLDALDIEKHNDCFIVKCSGISCHRKSN